MTNTAKKPAKTSRDTLDLDLDARLDQATSTLYLDEEPVEGDMLDQVLAKAKKELDAAAEPTKPKKSKEKIEPAIEPVAPEENLELGDGFNLDELGDLTDLELENEIEEPAALQSESLKSLENQLASVLDETPAVSDDEIDELLGGAGYDFDSLLGDADDELTANEAQLNEDSLLAAVDELLNFSLEPEAMVEPEIVEIEPEVASEVSDVVEPEIVEIEPEISDVVESETVEIEPEIVENDISDLDFEFEVEGFLEPEISEKTDLIDTTENEEVAFEEGMFEAETPKELQVEPEAALDDLVDSVPFEDTLKIDANDAEKDDVLAEEFNDFDDVADIAAPLVEISLPNDDELAQQLDGLNDAMENTNEKPAGFDLIDDETVEKESAVSTEKVEDESDWLKQLDDLDAQQSSEEVSEPEPVSFEKEEVSSVVEDDSTDWMKQLDDLDAIESPIEATETETEQTTEEVVESDDWMAQLDDDVQENAATETEEAVSTDEDWMSQLESLDDEAAQETVSDEDNWMKQLDSMDDSTETAAIDDDFNIADEPVRPAAPEIDEQAIIAKAAQFAIEQAKEEQDVAISALTEKHDVAFSQLRADQDTLETRTRKQFAEAENGRKKAATFGYAALGVGVIALLGSGGLGYMAYTAQNDTQTLKQSVSELEGTVNEIVNKAPEKEKEIEKIKTSVEQLNQKVDKLVADQQAAAAAATLPATTETTKNGSAMNLLNSKAAAPAVTTGKIETGLEMPKIADAPIAPAVDIAPAHPAGEEAKADTKLADMAKKSADEAKAKAEKLAAEKAAKAKADEAAKAEAVLLSEKLAKAAAVAKAAASTKTDEQRKLLAENSGSRYKGKMTRGMARGVEKERTESSKVASSKPTQERKAAVEAKTKEILNTAVKPQKAAPAGKYSVNVVSYQQEWFAQSKAAEFKEKGIPVEVVPVDPNNHATKFRLKVGGFKTKAEADSYAAKVKKTHGIDTWTAAN